MELSSAGELARVLAEVMAVGDDEVARAYVEELLGLLGSAATNGARATALGRARFIGGRSAGEAVADAMRLGAALEAALVSRGLDEPGRAGLRRVIGVAVAQVADGHEDARRGRRDRWLSHIAHDMRNSLNTLVNSLWILRNADQAKQQRICDMADRAVKKLEGQVKEMRELDERAREPAPGKPD